jgi:hypothetical protein
MRTPSLTIAFLRGDPNSANDRLVMDTTGGPFVHTEVLLAPTTGRPRAYSSFAGIGGVVPLAPHAYGPEWEFVSYPLSQQGFCSLYGMVLAMIAANPPYNSRDLWQCCIPLFLPFEADLDCATPSTWAGGVFCSQMACLLIRRACRTGHIHVPHTARCTLEADNTRGCSPNALFAILTGR